MISRVIGPLLLLASASHAMAATATWRAHDGSLENGYRLNTTFSEFAQLVPLPNGTTIEWVEVCLTASAALPPFSAIFEPRFYPVTSSGLGAPLLTDLEIIAPDPIPAYPQYVCLRINLDPAFVKEGATAFGVLWQPDVSSIYLSVDEDGERTSPAWYRSNLSSWEVLPTAGGTTFENFKNLGIAVGYEDPSIVFADGFESGDTSAW